MKTSRKRFDASFKARVALAALQEGESLAHLGQRFGVHPVVVGQWKRKLLKNAASTFAPGADRDVERVHDELLRKIGDARRLVVRGLEG